MNNEESQVLREFLGQLTRIQGVTRDAEADRMIKEAADSQPDALYLLVQKALLQDQALRTAQSQILTLQQALDRAHRPSETASSSGFLGRDPWAASAPAGQPMVPQAPFAPGAAPMGSGPWGGSPMGSFLGAAAATAAGVAGGAFLFHGIESLMGHHAPGSDFSDTGYSDSHPGPESVTVNQYYGDGYSDDQGGMQAGFSETYPDSEEDWDSYDDDVNSVDA